MHGVASLGQGHHLDRAEAPGSESPRTGAKSPERDAALRPAYRPAPPPAALCQERARIGRVVHDPILFTPLLLRGRMYLNLLRYPAPLLLDVR
jgi:hypothetical protein